MPGDLYSRLAKHAAEDPSRTALTFAPLHLDGQRVTLTYGDLIARSRQMAGILASRLKPSDRVLILLPALPEFAVSFLGCLASGMIAVPLPLPVDESSRRRVLSVVRDCSPSIIVSASFVAELVASAGPELRELREEFEWLLADAIEPGDGEAGRLVPVRGEDIAFLQYTSGSTRSPRGVMVSHSALMHNEAAIGQSFQVSRDSTIVSWLPLHHDMGLIGGLLQPLFAGARGVILDPLSFVRQPACWLETISRERADISGGPNFAYELCVRKVSAAEKANLDLSCWRVAFNGSGQVFPSTTRAFSQAFREAGFPASSHLPCYGLAEATLLVASAEPGAGFGTRTFSAASLESGRAAEADPGGDRERELVTYPLPRHATVRVVDPVTMAPVGEGQTGEILVASRSVGSGFWADPAGSAAAFRAAVPGEADLFLRTGDLGCLYGGDLYIQGRIKDLIVHRGRNLHPEDLEADISSCHPAVRPGSGAVFGVERDGDEAVVACQEIRPDTPPEQWPEIAKRIRETITGAHGVLPRTVILVPPRTIAKTSSGKIQRHAAKERFLAGELSALLTSTTEPTDFSGPAFSARLLALGPALPADAVTLAETLTRALCERLQAVLGLPALPGGDESLANLGADSLTAMQLQHEVEEALGISLRPSLTLRAASVAELAADAAEQAARRPAAGPPDVAVTPGGGAKDDVYELNAGQRALWFLYRAFPGSADYNVTRAFRVTGELLADALRAALEAVTRRHPSLQLAVLDTAGEPAGVIRPRAVTIDVTDGRLWREGEEEQWYRELATRPFELEHEPLIRAAVARRADDWLLVLSLHHIVCDLASFSVLVAELAQAYAEITESRQPDASDHAQSPGVTPAERERTILAADGAELAAYWRRELAGELPVLELPRVGQDDAATVGSVRFEADPGLTSALERFARKSGLTMHNVLLAAFQVLLHRLSGQHDLVVGIPVSGRADRRLASWVGYLVNVLPFRSRFTPGSAFAGFAAQTQSRILDALDHQDLPLSHMIRLVNPDRSSLEAAIFQAMFAYYTTALPGGEAAAAALTGDTEAALPLGRCELHGYPVADYTAQCDVMLNAVLRGGTLSFEIQRNPEKVSREQADQVATTFLTLLEAIAADPEASVAALPLLTAAETGTLVERGTGPHVPRPGHYLDSFERMAERFPDAVAVADAVTQLSYAELDERANYVAARLRAEGVGTEASVVVCAQRSADYAVALLGIHKAAGAYVPVSPVEAPRRAAAMLLAIAPAAVIADGSGRAMLSRATHGVPCPPVLDLASLAAGRSSQRLPRVCPAAGASTVIHTSGTTGTPKAAVSTNYGVTNHMWQMVEHFGLGPRDCVAQTGPVSFDISVWQMLTPLIVGARTQIIPEPTSQSPAGLLRATLEGGVTMLELVPSVIAALLDAGLAANPGALRVMLSTGETLTPELLRRWTRELPHIPIHNAYGPAECSDDVTAGLCARGPEAPMTVSIGRPLANTSVHALDDNLIPVPTGVIGTLYVGGGAVGRGYGGNPRRTAEVFVPDPWASVPGGRLYRTDDLGRWTAAGELEFLGRADRQTKIRGLRIEAAEVESALRQCPGVSEAALQVHYGPTGASLVGYIATDGQDGQGEPGAGTVLSGTEDERLRAALAEFLPRYMIPALLVRVPRLPRSKNGKVDHGALRFTARAPSADDPYRADDPLSAAVRSVWAELLERSTVGWEDSFFELGGHSLLALAMIDRVGRLLQVELRVDAVFASPRLGQFVELVRRADPASPQTARSPGDLPGPFSPAPASATQERFWFLREIDPGRPTYNMPGVLRIRGDLDADALEHALRTALERHSVLLARFHEHQGALRWEPATAAEFRLPRLDLRGAVTEFGEEVFTGLVETEAKKVADLRRDVPFRALLARLGAADWGLFVIVDHIVCDGWSLLVFMADLADAYNRRVRGQALAPAVTGYSFADYCHEERAWRNLRDPADVTRLWQGVADGPVSLSPLRARADSDRLADRAGEFVSWIGEDLAGQLRELAARTGTTAYMVFATALSALIHQGTSGRETILLGTLIAQRDRPEWRTIVGPLLNVGILAVDLALTDTIGEGLQRTQDAALHAYRSGHIPFQELAPLFSPAPGGDGSPFEVLLVMQPPGRPAEFDGLATELTDVVPGVAAYPLTVDIEQQGERYRVAYRYMAGRYDHADVEDLAERLACALRAIVTDRGRPLADLHSLAPQAERS
ncbi:MAG TPA: amino acid adenylation domain-containing protein [Streptosporangiaceae bacterium]|nr:amino acid adenylation domain-containing protein [Streptosporangiaceae bacterium]